MSVFLLSMFGVGKSLTSAIFAWLSRRSLSEIICLIMVLCIVVLYLDVKRWKHTATSRQAELVKCNATRNSLQSQLDSISTKRNEQQVITKDRIIVVQKSVQDADNKAKKIESAPSLPNCQSPKEVIDADI